MSYSFNTADVRQVDRFDFFQEAIAKSYVRCDLSAPSTQPFKAEIDLKSVDSINLSNITSSAMEAIIPRPKREISAPDVVFMNLVLDGYSRVVQDGREVETRRRILDYGHGPSIQGDDTGKGKAPCLGNAASRNGSQGRTD